MSLKNKVVYFLNKKEFNYKIDKEKINLEFEYNNIKYNFDIYHENFKVSFILINNQYLEEIENINLNIEDYEKMEDVINELFYVIKNDKNKKKIIKNNLEKIKDEFINNDNYIMKMYISKVSYAEMLSDQILIIIDNENYEIEIENLLEFKIKLSNFKINKNLEIILKIEIKDNILTNAPIINLNSNIKLNNNLLNKIENLKLLNEEWSIKYSLSDMINKIYNIIDNYAKINEKLEEIDNQILDLNLLLGIGNIIYDNNLIDIFDPDFKEIESKNNYWKKGTGYGHNNNKEWNINSYIKKSNEKRKKILDLISIVLENRLVNNKNFEEILLIFLNYLRSEEIDINIIKKFLKFIEENNIENYNYNEKLIEIINNYCSENKIEIKEGLFNTIIKKEKELSEYEKIFNKYKLTYVNSFKNYNDKQINLTNETIYKLQKEFKILKNGIILSENSNVFFVINNNDISQMRFIISGSKDTPYEYGLYIFDMFIDEGYPKNPPKVKFVNNGNKRFNPNLYDTGKVCLSLLGTWNGHISEKWNSSTSTFLQILISIQSLILIEEPYFNEPGYERSIGTTNGIKKSEEYNSNIIVYNIDHTINDLLSDYLNNKDYNECSEIIYEYFKFNKDKILESIDKSLEKIKKYSNNFNKLEKSKNKFIELTKKLYEK